VSRQREGIASRAAFDAGLSPEVIYTEPGLMAVRYLDGARTYAEADVRANVQACVEIVQRCHAEMGKRISGQGAIFWVFQILRDYAVTLKAGKHRAVPDLPRFMQIVDELEEAQVPLPIIFGHHDLLPTNFMDDGQRLWLIDWEYGAFGTAMFDLANIASNNSFDTRGERVLLKSYFGSPTLALERAFYAMKAASALREALWGMVSELHLNAPGVDYVAYAAEYLGRFERVYADYKRNFG
jgi:thiamine kinase-like enzyme